MRELESELSRFIIDTLNLDGVTVDDIDPTEPLFGDGLGLDSIDALELGVAIQRAFAIKIDANAVDLREKIIGPGDEDTLRPIRLQSGAPVDLNFQEASFKQAALALGRAYGVNMIFDESIEDLDISLFAENVSFQQAFTLLLKTNAAFYRRVGPNSVIIASDDPSTRAQYDDYIVRTFYIRSARAQQLADELSLILGLQTIAFDEEENTVTIRDTADKVRLADRYIISKDRKQAEVILEVEVLEVNRT